MGENKWNGPTQIQPLILFTINSDFDFEFPKVCIISEPCEFRNYNPFEHFSLDDI